MQPVMKCRVPRLFMHTETENQHKVKFNKKMICNYSMKQNDRKFVISVSFHGNPAT